VAALATAKAIERVTGLSCGIKWPNDIVIDGCKVCGILTEMSADMDCIHNVVIGIGVNVNMLEFDETIQATATSLRLQTGEVVSRAQLILQMLREFEQAYEVFVKTEDLRGLLAEYNERLVNKNRQVRIIERQNEWTATALHMNENGELVVVTKDGAERTILSGEVSVRGIYGYV
jgi:BirA family biotin operon repressor/biotin-[acetyl-CoA-carboxylase] ligase